MKTDLTEIVLDSVGLIQLVQDKIVSGFCEDDNETSDFIKCGKFLYYLRKC
jgi:hypothetical protein